VINFRSIKWKNLLSTGNIFTEIQLDESKTTLVVGANGAGKSTLLDAVCYVLFGKPFRKINKPELINRVTDRDLMVEVECTIDGHEYKIVRGMKPNVFEVYCDGRLLNQSADMRDYQEVLEKQILKINYKSFCQMVILGSAAFVPFMQLPGPARYNVVEDILDLQVFSTMYVLLKGRMTANEQAIRECEHKRTVVTEKMTLIREHMNQVQFSSDKMVQEKNERISTSRSEVKRLESEIADIYKRIALIKPQIKDVSALNSSINKLRTLRAQLVAQREKQQKEADFFKKYLNCPVCTQEITPEFGSNRATYHTDKIKELYSAVQEIDSRLSGELATLETLTDSNQELDKQWTELREKSLVIESQIGSNLDYVKELEGDLEVITEEAAAVDVGRLQELEEQLEQVEVEFNELHEEKKVQVIAASMLKDTGIKSRIVAQYVPVINKLINRYLAALDFVCNFQLNENFEEKIKSHGREAASYNSFSEGEKFRINIAILFTWRAIARLRNSASTNLLILDEILDGSLDFTGTDEFLKVLNQLTDDNNVFLISHRGETLVDKFPATIKFNKAHGFSKMELAA